MWVDRDPRERSGFIVSLFIRDWARLMIGFEAVTSIIFCVALSEYDQVLLEENGQVSRLFPLISSHGIY